MLTLALVALCLTGCSGDGQVTPPAEESSVGSTPEPCSEPWFEHVEELVSSGDGMGHGPDIGSDEWKSVIEFKLGVRGNAEVPTRSSHTWCTYIEEHLPREGAKTPS
ncbi:MAG: hypothetical protein IFK94_15580 [Acidobacteria bacterium]|uniref:Uncharacterized protein n=1 Tax=Candidatus Polarisedimenticola svalbardensis TaxID=2886004 RepID=A0A8J7C2U2_9BACT|nr:hypothetical protein [Candidatus Polarisedimenticola svalbardensis]